MIRFVTKLHPCLESLEVTIPSIFQRVTEFDRDPKRSRFLAELPGLCCFFFAGHAAKKNDCSTPVPWPCDNEDLASFPIQLINRNSPPLGQRLKSQFFQRESWVPGLLFQVIATLYLRHETTLQLPAILLVTFLG